MKIKSIFILVTIVLLMIVIVLTVVVIHSNKVISNLTYEINRLEEISAEYYLKEIKTFTPEQTIEDFYKWFNKHNVSRLSQLTSKECYIDSSYVNSFEYVNANSIEEKTPFSEHTTLFADKQLYDKKYFIVNTVFKEKDKDETRRTWTFILIKEKSDSPWIIAGFSTKP